VRKVALVRHGKLHRITGSTNLRDILAESLYLSAMLNLSSFSRHRRPDLAIDLGTANTRIVVRGEGVVFDEPSLCYFQEVDGRPRYVTSGNAVLAMVDRVPRSFTVRRPLARGVLQDIEATSALLAYGLATISGKHRRSRPAAIIGIPADATKAEANALLAAADDAGLGKVELIREPFAAAIGADLPIHESRASMIVECGAGTTEIAVFSIDGQCRHRSVRHGGLGLDEAIAEYLQVQHHFQIGRSTAERLKRELSSRSASDRSSDDAVEVKGRDLRTRLPGTISLPVSKFYPVFAKHFSQFAEATRLVLSELSPDLAADLLTERVVATGGGICATFLADAIMRECGVPVIVANDASGCVARGLERILEG
jgi:rod shape-determining protein MreB